MNKVIIVGTGLGGLSTALRLAVKGYKVKLIEKHSTPGGRVNIIEKEGFRFDLGPSFMSMTYELDELFKSTGIKNPLELFELDPLYTVFFENQNRPRRIFKDLKRLAEEFCDIEPGLDSKAERYLKKAGEFFHDTENIVVKSNFNNKVEYISKLASVPWKHLPYLKKTIWQQVEKHFGSEEVRILFSLVAFFLGATPFQTPAIYSLLNYTEMKHNGYWRISGGMYQLIEELVKILKELGVEFIYNAEITGFEYSDNKIVSAKDKSGNLYDGDIFICNSDAAAFRGSVLKREKYREDRLDKMHWTLSPFTIYLGIDGKIDNLDYHNYFLGSNFRGYAETIFTSSISPQKPYYYVNVLSKHEKQSAPEGKENVFILCPVPDLRFKKDWTDKEELANNIIDDLSKRIGFNIKEKILTKTILTPEHWERQFNLYKGSGLGLAHDINQVGAFRPKNKDEFFRNLYYVGASTTPGTGLPMVIISSRLVMERVESDKSL